MHVYISKDGNTDSLSGRLALKPMHTFGHGVRRGLYFKR
jgi:hypothetical protein